MTPLPRTPPLAAALLLAALALAPRTASAQAYRQKVGPATQRYSMTWSGNRLAPFPLLNCRATASPHGPLDADGLASYRPNYSFCPLNLDTDWTDLRFPSLSDRGTWDITCSTVAWPLFSPSCAADGSNPCGYVCNLYDGSGVAAEQTFHITVYNDPPTGSVSHTGASTIHSTVTFTTDARDPDGGGLTYRWAILARPPGSRANLTAGTETSASPTLNLGGHEDEGTWTVQLTVTDDEGESVPLPPHSITVTNRAPTLMVTGADRVLCRHNIELHAAASDPDMDPVSVRWAVQRPGMAWQDNAGSGPDFTYATPPVTGTQDWQVKATADDGHGGVLEQQVVVHVYNQAPRIDLSMSSTRGRVGQTAQLLTSVTADDDGGPLAFDWELVQAPRSAGAHLGRGYRTTSAFSLPTTAASAGTWVFILHATDDEGETTDSMPQVLLVDADPVARISLSHPTGNPVSLADFPLELSGSGSSDPDSPGCVSDLTCGHDLEPGHMLTGPSPGIVSYHWYVDAATPSSSSVHYGTGSVDDVFHVTATHAPLHFEAGDIAPGVYRFRLTVEDGEGNPAETQFEVTILDPHSPPVARISAPTRYLVSPALGLDRAVEVYGGDSFDPDALLHASPGPGVGIRSYHWDALTPPGCVAPPLRDGATLHLYDAGAGIPNACLGVWTVRLTVTDEDEGRTGFADTQLLFGSCPGDLCIDRPTAAYPALVESWDRTDVMIDYWVDGPVYDDPVFAYGMYARMEVLPHGGTTPVYSGIDPSPATSPRGALLSFDWNGFTTAGARVTSGDYDLRITLLDADGNPSRYQSLEAQAIRMEQARFTLGPDTDRYLEHAALRDRGEVAYTHFTLSGATLGVDALRAQVLDARSAEVYSVMLAPDADAFAWDGRAGGAMVPPGNYTVRLEAFRAGRSLASLTTPLTLYRVHAAPHAGGMVPPTGLLVMLDSDDDDLDGVVDLADPLVPGERDLAQLDLSVEPPLAGTLSVQGEGAMPGSPSPVKLFGSADKAGGERAQPWRPMLAAGAATPTAWVEAVAAGRGRLVLGFTAADGTALHAENLDLNLVGLEVVGDSNGNHQADAADLVAPSVEFARWHTAFDPAWAPLLGADPANFVEQDPTRFYLRVSDAAANHDPAAVEYVQAEISTLDSLGGGSTNPLVEQTLQETGPDTGVFVSRSFLLTSNDDDGLGDGRGGAFQVDPDDGWTPPDPAVGPILDNELDDRTLHAVVSGAVRADYRPSGSAVALFAQTPVCKRAPDERRKVRIRAHIFREPFDDLDHDGGWSWNDANHNGRVDVGDTFEPFLDLSQDPWVGPHPVRDTDPVINTDGRGDVVTEDYVRRQVAKANAAWAPSCVTFELVGPILHEDAPTYRGVDIQWDGLLRWDESAGINEYEALYDRYRASLDPNLLDVFFTAPSRIVTPTLATNANAVTVRGLGGRFGENPFTTVGGAQPLNVRTLAHELGHALTNTEDATNPQTEFYPAWNTGSDDQVNSYRRYPDLVDTQLHTLRPLGATDPSAVGNHLLQPY